MHDSDGAGDEAAEEGAYALVDGALADKLAGHGSDDAGADAGEEQAEGKDGAAGLADGDEDVVDAEEVGVAGVLGQGRRGDDEERDAKLCGLVWH